MVCLDEGRLERNVLVDPVLDRGIKRGPVWDVLAIDTVWGRGRRTGYDGLLDDSPVAVVFVSV